ncbi:MAG: HNH endonuclease [Rhodobacteraceae bacterium]|jgi:5-methylcytosine-specific restriction protein A|nr:HNH endonuclease [Paracoccaceae bacterium]
MTLAHNMAATSGIALPRVTERKRGTRVRSCIECGKIEQVRADNAAQRCRSCSSRASAAERFGKPTVKPNYETCQHCRCSFVSSPSNRQKYCSLGCLRAAKSVERTCATCGGSFHIPRSVLSGRTNASGRFCSRPCYERHLCRTPRIRGRGSRWKTIRKAALQQTPFCAFCGRTRHLQVHHIIPFRLTRDNSPTNLIPLCRACHKRVESVFHDVEAVDPPLPVTKLVLFCSIHARRTVTLHMLKSSAHAGQRAAA